MAEKLYIRIVYINYINKLGFLKKLEKLGPNFGCLSPFLMVNIVFIVVVWIIAIAGFRY